MSTERSDAERRQAGFTGFAGPPRVRAVRGGMRSAPTSSGSKRPTHGKAALLPHTPNGCHSEIRERPPAGYRAKGV